MLKIKLIKLEINQVIEIGPPRHVNTLGKVGQPQVLLDGLIFFQIKCCKRKECWNPRAKDFDSEGGEQTVGAEIPVLVTFSTIRHLSCGATPLAGVQEVGRANVSIHVAFHTGADMDVENGLKKCFQVGIYCHELIMELPPWTTVKCVCKCKC